MQGLGALLEASRARHGHLCPRQVLGVRMALAGAAAVEVAIPISGKPLLVIAETDGCFLDGLQAAAGVAPSHRTLRVEDYGKIAATFANVATGVAVRVAPRAGVRQRALDYAPEDCGRYRAQLLGYQAMPDELLLSLTPVTLAPGLLHLVSRGAARTNCVICGEEIINERETLVDGAPYCRACLGDAYYRVEEPPGPLFGRPVRY